METFEAIRTAIAIRKFKDTPIPADIEQEIVQAAHLSPSSMNGQPWHFIVVRDRDTLRRLSEIATTGHYIAEAPLAIVILITDSRFGVSDASRAIQDMILAGWSRGIGSNWVGFHGLDAVRPVLGVPEEWDVFAIVPFGYPAMPAGKGVKKRKPLGEVVSLEQFKHPYR